MLYKLQGGENDYINDQTLEELITCINQLAPSEDLSIYITGPGGELASCFAIKDIIETESLYRNITLIGYGHLYSCHFILLFDTMCQDRKILNNTCGMFHKPFTQGLKYSEGGYIKNEDENAFILATSKDSTIALDLIAKLKLNNAEKKLILSNSDSFFSYPRMLELVDISNKKNKRKKIVYENI